MEKQAAAQAEAEGTVLDGDGVEADAEVPPTELESPTELPPTVALPQPLLSALELQTPEIHQRKRESHQPLN